ncbi:hypothetical protein LTR91_020363 [Friedmanniomyces endolithicus]|uniref:Alpha-acetolactate decarboxylase n=1 Tax=Friedmanniomyces endolithicus TaxID=329885 RepID=A0AAN6HA84_9PEZI|nr:hypothetical protein LTR94_014688 [Friedmanniomyces endolithicus]KAK0783981.1 hypothetical protein LTR38_012842 [Friedmanniomyces endolithicus]KAK0789294.1 hypothetical protein LTR59_009723 [Friedmanniomyces endolithicus]KAK0815586.1 hypothetical protein LTR75_003874 [Friedmanniomyces endolithicus]KAK0835320.1 hypothetical protein LTR03_014047 [Friedmanniomyces endolithicus]
MEPNHIYQYSLLNALMDGVSETGIPVSKLLTKGNQGLGTFARMNGELLFLDEKVYQLQAEGNVREAGEGDQIPFAVTTNFVPQQTRKVTLPSKSALDSTLQTFAPHAKNLFLTYRITGLFTHLKCRTVRGQTYVHQPLSELGASQSVEEYHDVRGTIIGFRTPGNWQGFGVAGGHAHFIDEGRGVGGHVLELSAEGEEVEVGMAVVRDVHVELPGSEEFNEAGLSTDDEGVRKVEG